MPDLLADGAIKEGERTLLPQLEGDLGSAEANWARNQRVLIDAMEEDMPIRDASADTAGNFKPGSDNGFLKMERDVLRNHGWELRGNYWFPPSLPFDAMVK